MPRITAMPRRHVFALLGAAAASPAAAAGGEDGAVSVPLAFRKLAFSTGNAPFFWWLRGTRYGLVEGETSRSGTCISASCAGR